LSEAFELARGIAKRNRQAIIASKRLVRLSDTATVEDGMREELSVMSNNIGSAAQVQAVQEYFASRT
jgi:enoyl-CoA hydratase/carnithine racemase